MNEEQKPVSVAAPEGDDLKLVVREVIGEFLHLERAKAEPAYKAELADERRKVVLANGRDGNVLDQNHLVV